MDLHPAASRIRKGFAELAADVIAKHEGLEGHIDLRRSDRLEHRGKDLVAVDERRDAIAAHERWPQQDAQCAFEVSVLARVQAPRPIQQALLGRRDVGADPERNRSDDKRYENGDADRHVPRARRAAETSDAARRSAFGASPSPVRSHAAAGRRANRRVAG